MLFNDLDATVLATGFAGVVEEIDARIVELVPPTAEDAPVASEPASPPIAATPSAGAV